MEVIRQTFDRFKGKMPAGPDTAAAMRPPGGTLSGSANQAQSARLRPGEIALDPCHLESHRIIAHDVRDQRSKSFDILRTQILRTMDTSHWQMLAVTSPTPGCGKTLTSINLALSIARQSDRAVLLVDLDLQKPQVAATLGLSCSTGVLSVVEGNARLQDALIAARIGGARIAVLPTEQAVTGSSEWMTSAGMRAMLQAIRREFQSWTVILDMPPVLTGADVIAVLPQIDCTVLVAAAGKSQRSDIEEAARHLASADIVRVVLNKVPEDVTRYY
jgi:protein-tyrosine kinase